jgi:hypothetical protein
MLIAVVALCSAHASAQSADTTAARQQRALDSLTAVVRAMQARMDSLAAASTSAGNTTVDNTAASPAAAPQPSAAPRTGAYMNIGFVALTDAGWSTEPDVGSLQLGDHDPHVRGFSIPNTEITLDGAVDPYFKGFSNIVFKLDKAGETGVELEEAYLITTSLPANLQLKLGQFFAEFGRQNPQHPHSWAFVDLPLVLHRMFGPEGLRSQGARLSWLAPTPFYTEAMVSLLNSTGSTAYSFRADESAEIHGGIVDDRPVRALGDLLIVPRIASSFELGETQTFLVGASAAFGPTNSGATAKTQIYGVDAYYKWKPAAAQAGFPFVSLQSEAMMRRYDAEERVAADGSLAVLPNETLRDRGAYAQVLYGIKPRIVAGLRGDVVKGDDAAFASELRADRYRISPNFTWYPTEFSKIRFQYNYDDRHGIGTDHSLWMQGSSRSWRRRPISGRWPRRSAVTRSTSRRSQSPPRTRTSSTRSRATS